MYIKPPDQPDPTRAQSKRPQSPTQACGSFVSQTFSWSEREGVREGEREIETPKLGPSRWMLADKTERRS